VGEKIHPLYLSNKKLKILPPPNLDKKRGGEKLQGISE
jgi:hypothetical protein